LIGDRVRHARLYHGWSGTDLAERVGTSQPKISQLERDEYVSAELVSEIARATGFSRWWFDLGPLPDLPKGTLKFRKRASSSARDDERIRAHVRHAIEIVERLDNRPEVPPVRIKPCRPDSALNSEAIEQVALDVREQVGVGPSDPIPNVVRAVERAGVVVIGSAVEIEKHDGASFWPDYPYGRPIICVSRGTSGDRQRFNVSHELGHLVLHQFGNPDPKQAENEAHRFAGSFLIPSDALQAELADETITLMTLAHVKARWGISIRALIRRCLDLRLINERKRVSLEKQISSRGWTRDEPVEVAVESPRLLQRMIEVSTSGERLHNVTGLPPLASRDLIA
jgi:Zn-dependent peptidase ImmA (M78 family)/transcriptional regulator with XRE-family HTH domain